MDKRRLFIYLISIFLFLFLFDSKVVVAKETEILQYPVASDIYYGQPLFSSKLNGGIASVDGEFYWKNDDLVLDVGHHQEIVVFLPKNKEYECVEFDVAITVYKRRVYIEFEKKLTKLYDGNDSIEIPGYYIRGIVDDDVYVSGDIIAKLDSVFAGENVGVNISGLEIKGKNKDNYYLDLTGVVADVYKKHIETFENIKNRVEFNDDIYVPYDSIFQVKEYNGENVVIKNHKIKKIYSLNVISGNSIVNIEGNIFIKLKIDEKYINYKRIKLYNNYNGEYEEINYSYKDGYLTYNCNGLGDLIISTQDVNLIWLYILCSLFIFSLISYCVVRMVIKHNEIHRYKSLKRGKDYGNC